MSEVYLADDTKLKRPVVLKRMSSQLRADEHYRQRFLKEAELASGLADPHIAVIYELLEEKDETFLVMEYVEGTTLRPRLQRPFPLEEFLPVAIQCAEALLAAHEKGVVHRDIKPENIMLTAKGQVKILDFGVAKRLARPADADATASTASQPGTLSGTPAYMAPEVLLEKESDARADIFSLESCATRCSRRSIRSGPTASWPPATASCMKRRHLSASSIPGCRRDSSASF
jgi:serine/threonine-protein kinase